MRGFWLLIHLPGSITTATGTTSRFGWLFCLCSTQLAAPTSSRPIASKMAPPEPARERQRRRKVTLACEPCRERKARCDGRKPICSTCEHRSLGLEQCIYKAGNARTACGEE